MGNRDRAERKLPPTGWTWQESVEAGKWAALAPESVVAPATFGLLNGARFQVEQGVKGVLVHNRAGEPVVFAVCAPATRDYRVMTRADGMPALIGEVV